MRKRVFRPRHLQHEAVPILRRFGVGLIFAAVAAVQFPGCSVLPVDGSPRNPTATANAEAVEGDFKACAQSFPSSYMPTVTWPGRQRALCFEGFAVLHSGESKTALYAVERLTRASVSAAKSVKRTDRFYAEARLPMRDRAQLEDYAGSGYDRGHMAPAGDMPTDTAKAQSFSLANMVPQAPELNQRDWNEIEQATRKYALRSPGDVFVFTGPLFDQHPETIGPGRVWIPSHTWKVVYSPAESRAWAYWMTNTGGRHSLKPISYRVFEQRSGITLLRTDGSGGLPLGSGD